MTHAARQLSPVSDDEQVQKCSGHEPLRHVIRNFPEVPSRARKEEKVADTPDEENFATNAQIGVPDIEKNRDAGTFTRLVYFRS